jgi:hypothetical protein
MGELGTPIPDRLPFGSSVWQEFPLSDFPARQYLSLVSSNDVYQSFTYVDHAARP